VARRLVALALLVAFAGAARAQDKKDDFKWDPKKKAKPVEGYKAFDEGTDSMKQHVKAKLNGQALPDQKKESTTTFRVLEEVVKVTDGKKTEVKFKVEKWKQSEGEEDDTCLEGKTVVVKGTGADTKWELKEKDVELSDGAKAWIDKELAKKDEEDKEAFDKAGFPQKPIGDGETWDGDAKAFAELLFKDKFEIDPEKSSLKGTLSGVHVEDGIHCGKIELKAKFAIKKSDQLTEGGTIELTITADGSLEPDKREAGTMKMDMKLEAKSNQETEQGTANVTVKVDAKREGKQGPIKD